MGLRSWARPKRQQAGQVYLRLATCGLPWCTHDGIPSHSHARSQQRQHNKVLLLLFHFRFFLPTHIHLFIRRHRKRQHQHPDHHSQPSSPPPSRPPPLPRTWPDGDEERERWVCVRACGIGSIPLLFLFYCPLCGNGRMSDWAVGIHWVHVLLCLRLSLLLHLHSIKADERTVEVGLRSWARPKRQQAGQGSS